MEVDKKEQLRRMLAGFAGEGLLPLDEATKLLRVSESYLLSLVRRGKVKAFKVDEHWFIKLDWLEQFRQEVREHISEITAQDESSIPVGRWVKPIKKKKLLAQDFLIFSFRLTAASFTLAAMVLASAWMMPFSDKVATSDDYLLSGVFVVSGVYAKPARAFSEAVVSGSKINDEELTHWSRSVLGGGENDAGQVAGASEGFGD